MTLPPATAPASRPWKTCLILLGLTLFAGIIRFYSIGRPCLWGDEVMTYARASGDYRDLLDVLKDDGFVPLHYTLYWAIISICKLGSHGRLIVRLVPTLLAAAAVALPLLLLAFRRRWTWATAGTVAIAAVVYALMLPLSRITVPTPLVMRFVPALAGTLAVPAMYFLAVQIVRRSAALLAAALTACSGYLMVYSRDAKMYMHFWLFCIVSVACLLWWLRRGTRLAWLAWLAAGVAAAGLHAIYLMLLPVQLIVVLTIGSWRWPRLALFALGCVVISAGPIGYYAGFNHWLQNIDDKGWNSSGLQWIDPLNAHRTGPELCLDTSTAYLTGWEWPPLAWRPDIAPAALSAMLGLTTAIFALLALGLFPWRRAFPPLRGGLGRGPSLLTRRPNPGRANFSGWAHGSSSPRTPSIAAP